VRAKAGEAMDAAARQFFELAFMIAWIGGYLFWFARLWIIQREFHLQFGFDFKYMYPISRFSWPYPEPFFRRTFTRQSDPYLEGLRQKVIKRMLQMAAWLFLFPIPFVIVLSLLPPLGNAK
jgi:hypothetical protein